MSGSRSPACLSCGYARPQIALVRLGIATGFDNSMDKIVVAVPPHRVKFTGKLGERGSGSARVLRRVTARQGIELMQLSSSRLSLGKPLWLSQGNKLPPCNHCGFPRNSQ
jgi:hypothetical protein